MFLYLFVLGLVVRSLFFCACIRAKSLYQRVFVGRRHDVKKGGQKRISCVGGGGIPAESEIPRSGLGGGVIRAISFLYSSLESM